MTPAALAELVRRWHGIEMSAATLAHIAPVVIATLAAVRAERASTDFDAEPAHYARALERRGTGTK